MKIFIDDLIVDGVNKGKIYIESDSMQYILCVYNGKKDVKSGKEIRSNDGDYHKTLEQALNKVVRMKIHNSTKETINELLEEVKVYKQYIKDKCEGL